MRSLILSQARATESDEPLESFKDTRTRARFGWPGRLDAASAETRKRLHLVDFRLLPSPRVCLSRRVFRENWMSL